MIWPTSKEEGGGGLAHCCISDISVGVDAHICKVLIRSIWISVCVVFTCVLKRFQ